MVMYPCGECVWIVAGGHQNSGFQGSQHPLLDLLVCVDSGRWSSEL